MLRFYEPAGELDFQELLLIREVIRTFKGKLDMEPPYPSEAHWFYQRCCEHAFRSAADYGRDNLEGMKANTRRLEQCNPDDNPFRDANDKPALANLMQCTLEARGGWSPTGLSTAFSGS